MTAAMSSGPGPNESFASLFEHSAGATTRHRRYRVGESLEVTIVAITRDAVFADLGGKQEGVLERAELADTEGNLRVELGSRVTAVVTGIDGSTGQVWLSPVVIRTPDAGHIGVARPSAATGPVLAEGARNQRESHGGRALWGLRSRSKGLRAAAVAASFLPSRRRRRAGPTSRSTLPWGRSLRPEILAVDDTGKIRLSIAALSADEERGAFEAFKSSQSGNPPEGEAQVAEGPKKPTAPRNTKPSPRNFGTLADLLPKGLPTIPKPEPTPRAGTVKPATSPGASTREGDVRGGRRMAAKRAKA